MPGPGMPGPGMPPQDKASGMAIASLILSIAGLLCGITAIIGIVLGAIELSRINKGVSSPKGKGLALGGIIIGAIVLGLGLLLTIISIATGGFSFEVQS